MNKSLFAIACVDGGTYSKSKKLTHFNLKKSLFICV